MYGTILNRSWRPWAELETMERVFDDIFGQTSTDSGSSLTADSWVEDDAAHIVVKLPGVPKDSVEISMEGRSLKISGERKEPELGEGESWHRRERWHGKFERSYTLPFNVEEGKIKAEFKDGLLSVTLPKADSEKPRKIAISAK